MCNILKKSSTNARFMGSPEPLGPQVLQRAETKALSSLKKDGSEPSALRNPWGSPAALVTGTAGFRFGATAKAPAGKRWTRAF